MATILGQFTIIPGTYSAAPTGWQVGDVVLLESDYATEPLFTSPGVPSVWTTVTEVPSWFGRVLSWYRISAGFPGLRVSGRSRMLIIRGCVGSGSPIETVGSNGLWDEQDDGQWVQANYSFDITAASDGALALFFQKPWGSGVSFSTSGTPALTALDVNGTYGSVYGATIPSAGGTATVQVHATGISDTWSSSSFGFVTLKGAGGAGYLPPGGRGRLYSTFSDPVLDLAHLRMDIPRLWKKTRGNPAIRAALVDTGYLDHPKMPAWAAEWNSSTGTADGHDISSTGSVYYGHGAGTASILFGKSTGAGAPGIAPDCTPIMVACVSAGSSMGPAASVEAAAVLKAYTPIASGGLGADVVSVSIGSVTGVNGASAVAAGCLVFGAAGNSGIRNDGGPGEDLATINQFPGEEAGVICVSACDPATDEPASWANYGAAVDLVAPYGYTVAYTSGGYRVFGGTSSATPAAAGVGADCKGLNPALTAAQIEALLHATGDVSQNANFLAKFPYARVPNGGKAAAAFLATLPGGLEIYARFTAATTPLSIYTVAAGSIFCAPSGDTYVDLAGYRYNEAAPASPLNAEVVEFWIDDACVFAGPPQKIRGNAVSEVGAGKVVRVVARGPSGSVEESFDDVVLTSFAVTSATYALTAGVKSRAGAVAVLAGSRVPNQPVSVGGVALSEQDYTSPLTWEKAVTLSPGANDLPVVSGGDSLTATVEYHAPITATCLTGAAEIGATTYDPADPHKWEIIVTPHSGLNTFAISDGVETVNVEFQGTVEHTLRARVSGTEASITVEEGAPQAVAFARSGIATTSAASPRAGSSGQGVGSSRTVGSTAAGPGAHAHSAHSTRSSASAAVTASPGASAATSATTATQGAPAAGATVIAGTSSWAASAAVVRPRASAVAGTSSLASAWAAPQTFASGATRTLRARVDGAIPAYVTVTVSSGEQAQASASSSAATASAAFPAVGAGANAGAGSFSGASAVALVGAAAVASSSTTTSASAVVQLARAEAVAASEARTCSAAVPITGAGAWAYSSAAISAEADGSAGASAQAACSSSTISFVAAVVFIPPDIAPVVLMLPDPLVTSSLPDVLATLHLPDPLVTLDNAGD